MIANHRSTETLHRFKSCTFRQVEDTAAWAAIGLENRGSVKRGRSIRLSSAKAGIAQMVEASGLSPDKCKFESYFLHQKISRGSPTAETIGLDPMRWGFESLSRYQINGDMAELDKAPGCNPAVPNRFEVRVLMAPPKGSK